MTSKAPGKGRLSNRQKTWIWILATTAIVFGLLYWEQIALLYVLATVSVTLLLLVVAVADLSGTRTNVAAAATVDDALSIDDTVRAIGTGSQSTFGSRPRKNRR